MTKPGECFDGVTQSEAAARARVRACARACGGARWAPRMSTRASSVAVAVATRSRRLQPQPRRSRGGGHGCSRSSHSTRVQGGWAAPALESESACSATATALRGACGSVTPLPLTSLACVCGADTAKSSARRCLPSFLRNDLLLTLTLAGVLAGCALGALLRGAGASERALLLAGFPGELMLRSLKMVVAPLIAGSIVGGITNLSGSGAGLGRLVRATLGFYALSMAAAVAIGCMAVGVFRPGAGRSLPASGHGCGSGEGGAGEAAPEAPLLPPPPAPALSGADIDAPVGFLDSMLGVARSLVPANIFEAFATNNVLGIITFSVLFGAAVVSLGERAAGVARGVDQLNIVIERVVKWVVWVSPIGIASLVAAEVGAACDLGETAEALSLWIACVLCGLAVFALAVLPALLLLCTRGRGRPLQTLVGSLPALAAAFGTDSSTAALPVTIECARRSGVSEAVARFVCPLGAVINMGGTALYESVTVLFIAQVHGEPLPPGRVIAIALTSTLAALGAATVPSAGVVTMLMVLQATGLGKYSGDLGVILAVDWFLDRFRTAVNVLGDTFAAQVVNGAAAGSARRRDNGSRAADNGGLELAEL